jgi:hypothetical protein
MDVLAWLQQRVDYGGDGHAIKALALPLYFEMPDERTVIEQIDRGGAQFYLARNYRRDFLAQGPNHPYIVINDVSKVAQPVLVTQAPWIR